MQINIDKNNYQAFILDYYEGNLSKEQADMLMSFLEKHPELQNDFDDFELLELDADKDSFKFEDKGFLKKPEPEYKLPVTQDNYEVFCIAEAEGLLSQEEVDDLNLFISQNPYCKRTRDVYKIARIEPDENVVLENKEGLKKQPSLEIASVKIDENNFEEFVSAYIDDELNMRQKEAVEDHLKNNPERKKEFDKWKLTKLKADLNITFPAKSSLKRHSVFYYRQVWQRVSAAAVILLVAGLFFIFDMTPDMQQHYVDLAIKERITHDIEERAAYMVEFEESIYMPKEVESTVSTSAVTVSEVVEKDNEVDIIKPQPLNADPIEPLIPARSQLVASITPTAESAGDRSNNLSRQQQEPVYDDRTQSVSEQAGIYTSLSQFALAELQKRTGIESGSSDERQSPSFGDFAGRGLAAISQITGKNLSVNKERDQQTGRITYLAIGDSFAISRGD